MTVRAISGGWVKNGRGSAGGASLSLNFLNGITDYRITYSGGVNGTRVNSAGNIVAAVAPRYDYNPVTLAARGLLVEETRTNLRLGSGAIGGANWVDASAATRTANQITAPDGTLTGCLVTASGASSPHYIGEAVSEGAGVKTNSVFVKMGTQRYFQIAVGGSAVPYANFDLQAGTAFPFGSGTTAGIESYGNGWYRCWMATTAVLADGSRLGFVTGTASARLESNNLATTLYLWGAQCEAVSTFPTSYIPTTTAAVTRTADSAVMTGTNFSSWYNQSEGTFVVSADVLALQATAVSMDVGAGGAFGTTAYAYQTATALGIGPPAAPVNMDSSVATTALANKYAVAMMANNTQIAVNGTLGTLDSSCAMPASATTLTIGKGGWSGGANHLNGHIQTIQYFPRRIANTQLQALTV